MDIPSVPLESRCQRDILEPDRNRGYAYFKQGRVRLSRLFPAAALAVVEGTEDYVVAVEGDAADRGVLNVLCSCARFEDGLTCKHIWATLLAMDAEDESWRIGGTNELRFNVDTLFEMGLFDNPELSSLILASAVRQPAKPPSPTWQSQLAQVDDRVSYYRSLSADPRRGNKREIIYRLDIGASMARGDLVVTFPSAAAEEKRDSGGKMKSLAVTEFGPHGIPGRRRP